MRLGISSVATTVLTAPAPLQPHALSRGVQLPVEQRGPGSNHRTVTGSLWRPRGRA